MFFRRKEEMYLGSFVRLVVGTFLRADLGDISVIDTEHFLDNSERNEIKKEIEFLRPVLLMFQLMIISRFGKKEFTPQELGRVFGTVSVLAYQDIGLSKEEVVKKAEAFIERYEYYTDAVENTDQKELGSKGVFFYLIKYFADLILKPETAKFRDQSFQDKHFFVFDMGRQIYRHDEKVLKDLLKNVKFMDE